MHIQTPYTTLSIALTGEHALLPFDQIRAIAQAALECGISSLELCGGEPLEREDLPLLCMMLSALPGFTLMDMTTGGLLMPRLAKPLRGAGVGSVTIRLDTFDPAKYRMMTGGKDFTAVLAGIRACMEVGFPPVTLLVRLIRGVNDDEIPSLVRLTKSAGVSLRFTELSDAEASAFTPGARMTCEEALRLAPDLCKDEQLPGVYRLPGAGGTVAFVPDEKRYDGRLILEADGRLHAGDPSCAIALDGMDDAHLHAAFAQLMR